MPEFIAFGDLVNSNTGKTFRQENLEKEHRIPIGALVEIRYKGLPHCDDPEDWQYDGIRLHVVAQTRDCDGTPMYSLGIMREGWEHEDLAILETELFT